MFEWWYFTMNGLSISEDDEQKRPYSAKERRSFGQVQVVNKKIKFKSHETGAPCNCVRKCSDLIELQKRNRMIKQLNKVK